MQISDISKTVQAEISTWRKSDRAHMLVLRSTVCSLSAAEILLSSLKHVERWYYYLCRSLCPSQGDSLHRE